MRSKLFLLLFVFFFVSLISTALANDYPPKPNAYFMGDANGDTGVTGTDLIQHYNYILSKAYTYDTLQPNNPAQAWNTCDINSDRGCTGTDTVVMNSYLLSKSVSIVDEPWELANLDLPLTGNSTATWIPFTIDLHSTFTAAASGRPGISVVVEIDPILSTISGYLSGRECNPVAGTRDQSAVTGAQCALSVTQTNWPVSTGTGPTESGLYGLQVMGNGNGDLNLLIYTTATPGLDIPATSLRLNVSFGTVTPTADIDCSNPGPNPVNEYQLIQCTVTGAPGTPIVDSGTDTCGGTITAGIYSFTPGEGGTRTCVAGVINGTATDSDIVNIIDVNQNPVITSTCATTATEGVLYTCNLTATDADLPAQTLTWSLSGDTCGGTIVGSAYTWTPTEAQGGAGACVVGVQVADNFATPGTDTQSTTVTPAEVNQSPTIALTCPASVTEPAAINCTIAVGDGDLPVNTLSCSLGAGDTCGGALTGCTNYDLASSAGKSPSCVVDVEVNDNAGQPNSTDTDTATVTVIPESVTLTCPASANEDASFSCTITSTGGSPCSIGSITGACTGLTITDCTQIDIAAQGEAAGPGSCFVKVEKGTASDTKTITIDEVNQNPTISLGCPASAPEDTATSCAITASDADLPAQGLTCSLNAATTCTGVTLTGCATVDIAAQGELAGPGSCAVAVDVQDSFTPAGTAMDSASVVIDEVNLPPSIGMSCPTNMAEDASGTCTLTVSDPDNVYIVIPIYDNFESGTNGWSISGGLWHMDGVGDPCQNFASPLTSWYYGNSSCNYDTGVPNSGYLYSPSFVVPNVASLFFNSWEQTEGGAVFDTRIVWISTNGGGSWTQVAQLTDNSSTWYPVTLDLSAYAGQTAMLAFQFDTVDSLANNYQGWYIDDVVVSGQSEVLSCSLGAGTTCTGVTLTDCTSADIPAQGEAAGPGSCTVDVQVSDNFMPPAIDSASAGITIDEVNQNPTWSVAPTDIIEMSGVAYNQVNGQAVDADIPSQTLTCSNAGQTCSFTVLVTGSGVGAASCNISFTAGQLGELCTVTVQATDDFGGFVSQVVNISVNERYLYVSNGPYAITDLIQYTDRSGLASLLTNLNNVVGIAVDKDQNVYACTWGAATQDIWKIDPSGTTSVYYAGLGAECTGLSMDQTGALYASLDTPPSIFKVVAPGLGFPLAILPGWPFGNVVGSDGNVYVTDNTNGQILMVDQLGAVTPYTPPMGFIPWDLDFDNLGNLYTTNGNGTIYRIPAGGGFVFPFVTLPLCGITGGVEVDRNTNMIYATCQTDNIVYQVDQLGTAVPFSPSPTANNSYILSLPIPSVNIDCTNPGPNPVDELSPMSCTVTTTNGIPAVDPVNDTCFGIISGPITGPWTYDLTPTEPQGPGSCVAAVRNWFSTDADSVMVNEANLNPSIVVNCPASVAEDTATSCALTAIDPDLPAQTLTCGLSSLTTCTGVTLTGCTTANIPAQGEMTGPGSCTVVVEVWDDQTPQGYFINSDTVNITEANQIPSISLNCPANLAENAAGACTLTVSDPDNVAVPVIALSDDFESGPNGWTISGGLWHMAGTGDPCQNFTSPVTSWYYGNSSCNYDVGTTSDILYSPSFVVPNPAQLNFWSWEETEGGTMWDIRRVWISTNGGGSWTQVAQLTSNLAAWYLASMNLSAYAGQTAILAFQFNSVDGFANDYQGWYIDDVRVGNQHQDLTCSLGAGTTCVGATITGCDQVDIPAQGEAAGPGTCMVEVEVTDSGVPPAGASTTDNITIDEANEPPTVSVACPASANETDPFNCTLTVADTDLPPQLLTCSIDASSTCTGATVNGCASVDVAAQGEAAGPGNCTLVVNVSDGFAPPGTGQGDDSVSIVEINQVPTMLVDCPATVVNDAATACTLTAADPDLPAQALTCSLNAATTCTGATITGCAQVDLPAQGTPGNCDVWVDVVDDFVPPGTAQGMDTIRVISRPYWSPAPTDIYIPSGASYEADNGHAADIDSPADILTCSLASNSCVFGVTVTGTGYGAVDCHIKFTSAPWGETCSIDVQVSDGTLTITQSVAITVEERFLYLSDRDYNADHYTDNSGAVVTTFYSPINSATGIAVDPDRNAYVCGEYSTDIIKITPAGVTSVYFSGLTSCWGLAIDTYGVLYAAEVYTGNIFKITGPGTGGVIAGGLTYPTGLAIGPTGDLYISEWGNDRIWSMTPAGVLTVYATPVASPYDLDFDAAGNLFVATGWNADITQIAPGGLTITSFATLPGCTWVTGLEVNNSTNNVYASCSDNGEIYSIDTLGTPTLFSSGFGPRIFSLSFPIEAVPLTVGMVETFEGSTAGWTASGLWHMEQDGVTPCPSSVSATHSFYYGDGSCDFDTGVTNSGDLISPAFIVPDNAQLYFNSMEQTEGGYMQYDRRRIYISTNNGATWTLVREIMDESAAWYLVTVDLSPYAGKKAKLRFNFDTVDDAANGYLGWYLDDIVVATGVPWTVFFDDMESGVNGWTTNGVPGLWHQAGAGDPCQNFYSPVTSWYYGNSLCNYDTGATNFGNLFSPQFVVPEQGVLSFWSWEQTENAPYDYDRRNIYISTNGGASWTPIRTLTSNLAAWYEVQIDISAYAGQTAMIAFQFDSVDDWANNYQGWYVDDVAISGYPVKTLTYVQYVDGWYLDHQIDAINQVSSAATIYYTNTDLADQYKLYSAIVGKKVVFIPPQTYGGDMVAIGTAWGPILQRFVNDGGTVVVTDSGWENTWQIINSANVMFVAGYGGPRFGPQPVNVVAPTDLVATGVASPYTGEWSSVNFLATDGNTIVDYLGLPVVVHKAMGAGNVILIGHNYGNQNADQSRILGNAILRVR